VSVSTDQRGGKDEAILRSSANATSPRRRIPFLGELGGNRDFVNFWVGETLSLFGTQVTALALPLTAVLTLHATAPQLGILRFSQFVPFLLLTLLFGVWADRRRRLSLMVCANGARAALIGVVPVLAILHQLNLELLYGLVFAIGTFTVLFDVCWMSVLPTLVSDEDQLVEANSKVGASYSAAEVAGPGLAGVLIQVLTAPVALVIDACSYVVALISLVYIRGVEKVPDPPASGERGLARELASGLRLVVGNPYLRVIAILGGAFNFFFMFTESIFVLYAVRSLSFGPALLGVVLSASAVGGLIGTVAAPRLTRRFPLGAVYTMAIVVGFWALLLIPAATGPTWLLAITFIVAFLLITTGIGVANVVSISLRQRVTPDRMMGRMTAAMRMVMYGLGAPGALVGGFLAASLGLRPALLVAAVGSCLSVLPLPFSPIPRLRALPPAASEE
jgi:MFS family permease